MNNPFIASLTRIFCTLAVFFNFSAYANNPRPLFQNILKVRLDQVMSYGLPPVDSCLGEIVRSRQFVFYPGDRGNATKDVFEDNKKALLEDFAVDPQDVTIRDVEDAYNQIHRPDITKVRAKEHLYLRELYRKNAERNGGKGKPFVFIAHSSHGLEMFEGLIPLFEAGELKEGGMIDRVIFLEAPISPSRAYHILKDKDVAKAARKKILYIGWASPSLLGTVIGDVSPLVDHVSQVVSEGRSNTPYIQRQALTRSIMEAAYWDCKE